MPQLHPSARTISALTGVLVHIVIATLYGLVAWVSLLAYTVIVGGPWGCVLALGPFIVSGIICAAIAIDMALAWIRGLWRRRDPKMRP